MYNRGRMKVRTCLNLYFDNIGHVNSKVLQIVLVSTMLSAVHPLTQLPRHFQQGWEN